MGFCQMEKTFYIIAGSFDEAVEYVKQKRTLGVNLGKVVVVNGGDIITEDNPSGVCIGRWKERGDAWSLLRTIYDLTDKDNEPKLQHILKILMDLDKYRQKS